MAPPAGGGQADNSMGILWTIAAIFAAIGIIWYAFSIYLIVFYLTIKLYETDFLNIVTDNRYADLQAALQYALTNAGTLSFANVVNLGEQAGLFWRYPLGLLLAILAVVLYFSHNSRAFRRTYSLRELVRLEKGNWPQILPVAHLDLLKTDLDAGPWAMSMQPMQFCKKYNLLIEVRPERRPGMTRKEWDKVDVVLKRGEATQVFILQLGPLWRGAANLPPHIRGLFAAFAARINADSKTAATLLKQFNLSSMSKTLDLRDVESTIKKYENTKGVQDIVTCHAYVYTVLASMLQGAREDGVQASADFLWLKKVDRRLWYTLNSVGRQTAFIETAGIFAHWKAEKEAKTKLLVPMVEEATKALETALKEIVYKPDEVREA
jgi:intracellular multiplication protein IcmP